MHYYQLHASDFILDHKSCGVFMGMGLGKTISALTAVEYLMYQDFEISKCLVIAPKNTAENVWSEQIELWDHVKHLKYSLVIGSEKHRKTALNAKSDVYVIGRDNLAWLVTHLKGHWPFDMVIADELSSFKNRDAQRFKALKMVRSKIKRFVGLTGTPAPNGLIDL